MRDEHLRGEFGIGPQLSAAMLMLDPGSARNLLGYSAGYAVCTDNGGKNEHVITNADCSVSTAKSFNSEHNAASAQRPESFNGKRADYAANLVVSQPAAQAGEGMGRSIGVTLSERSRGPDTPQLRVGG